MGMMSIGKEMLSREDIEARVREIGEQISKDYEDKELLLLLPTLRLSQRSLKTSLGISG